MYSKMISGAVYGIESYLVFVEVDISEGLPCMDMVGFLSSEVKEAREKSGTFITVDMALEQGRDVFAVPGRVTDPLSAGCNRLISDGAAMVLKLEELLQGVKGENCNINKEKYVHNEQTKENAMILEMLDFEAKTIQNIYNNLNKVKENEIKTNESEQPVTLEYVREQLLLLEKSGKIVCRGGYYVKNYE